MDLVTDKTPYAVKGKGVMAPLVGDVKAVVADGSAPEGATATVTSEFQL